VSDAVVQNGLTLLGRVVSVYVVVQNGLTLLGRVVSE